MPQDKVMLLIDADNVSLDVIEQAVAWVAKHYGGPHVRRAYCTAESAVKHQGAFKRLGIRPMVNLAAGKNSTDIALAVDAIDLTLAERPQVVVIASSDSDFAPLVGRLREKGSLVVGIGQRGKTGDETRSVYDDYEVMEHHRRGGAGASVRPPQEPAPSANAASGRRSRRRSGQRQGAGAQAGPEGQPATGAPAASAPTPGPMGAPVSAPTPTPTPTGGASLEAEQQQSAPRPRRRGGKAARSDRGAASAVAGPGARDAAPPAQPLPPGRPEISPSPLVGEGLGRGAGADIPAPAPLSPSPSPARGEGSEARRRDRSRSAGEGGQPLSPSTSPHVPQSPSPLAGEGLGRGGSADAAASAPLSPSPSPARGEGRQARRRDRARPAGEGAQAAAPSASPHVPASPSPLLGEGSARGGSADTAAPEAAFPAAPARKPRRRRPASKASPPRETTP